MEEFPGMLMFSAMIWIVPILSLAVTVFALVLLWRATRALERIAECMLQGGGDVRPDGSRGITT